MPHIGVLGAGIAGLTAAYRLRQKGLSVEVIEATSRPGGVIRSDRTKGYLVERGPNSVQATSLLEDIIADLNLTDKRVWANDTADRRYIVREGGLKPVPTSIGTFLSTDLFSTRAKLRLLAEPFIGRRPTDAPNESLADFVRRRLGSEMLDYAVAPFVGGVFAGDPEQLSVRHAFEKLHRWERQHGSLFWGALRSSATDSPTNDDSPSGLFSFHDGLETLPRALADHLGENVTYSAPVTALRHHESHWVIHLDTDEERPSSRSFDGLISTLPLHEWNQLTYETSIDCSSFDDVPYPPVRIVALGYEQSAVSHPLDGFGVLVPPIEDEFDILGTLFSSTLFPRRAPSGHVLLTTFVGGARQPTLAKRSPDEVQALVESDLRKLLGVEGEPTFTKHVYWPQAIPQYTLDHDDVTQTLHDLEREHSHLYFAGNYRDGLSVGDAMASGAAAADRIA